MYNFLYLTMAAVDATSGVYKKIRAQVESFEKQGYVGRILFITDDTDAKYFKSNEIENVNLAEEFPEIKEYIKTCEFCYVRFELLRHKNYKKILDISRECRTKIITEIPTFPPYQESMARVRAKLRDKNYAGALKTFIGAGLVVSDMNHLAKMSEMVCVVADDYQFRLTKTIRIENGINLESNPYAGYIDHGCINIIAVSNFAVWNGYDRAVEGIKLYNDTNPIKRVNLILVGPLNNAPELKKRVEELELQDCVQFTGALSGDNLNAQYARADIALGALGNHRRKVFANSSLKVKEYAVRGMLMVLSDAEGIEDEILRRSFVVKSDESPIDFSEIVNWFENIGNKEAVKKEIHQFAVEHYSWDYQTKKVLDEFYKIH